MNKKIQLFTVIISFMTGSAVIIGGVTFGTNILVGLGIIIYLLTFYLASMNLEEREK